MSLPPRFSELSQPRQALVRLCQTTGYGYVQDLLVEHREPVFSNPQFAVFLDIKLDSEERARQEVELSDFILSAELVRLMALLDKVQDGKIAKIEIRGGIPRRIIWENRHRSLEAFRHNRTLVDICLP